MTTIGIKELFHLHRFHRALDYIPLFFYFPLGLSLSIVRFFIGCHTFLAACILPKSSLIRRIVLRTMCTVLGIVVKQDGYHFKETNVKVMVSNHVTSLDRLAVDLVLPSIMPGVWNLPWLLNWLLGFKNMGVKQGRDVLIKNVKKHIKESNIPVLTFPEGATTNGKVGLLKFSTWPFSLDQPVQPVLITTTRLSLLDAAPSVLGSYWWTDIFWFLFVPVSFFTIRYLPVMERKVGESVEEFTRRVQQIMAYELGVKATCFTCADKVDHAKRMLSMPMEYGFEKNVNTRTIKHSQVNLARMVEQVKEILPYVPVDVIKDDLIATKNADLTISRILEGAIRYKPEENYSSSSFSGKRENSNTRKPYAGFFGKNLDIYNIPPLNTSAKLFEETSEARMKSYEERKALLVENAKIRYLHKHCIL